MEDKPTHLLIPLGLAQAISNYLHERPYKEVAMFIGGLAQLQAPEPPKTEEKGK